MNLRRLIPGILLGLLGSGTLAVFLSSIHAPKTMVNNRVVNKQILDRRKANLELSTEAAVALKKGDMSRAESLYVKLVRTNPQNPFMNRYLASVYDAEHKDREAFEAWNIVVKGVPGAHSSDQTDTVILTHFGDLCLEFGDVSKADSSYETAVANAYPYLGSGFLITAGATEHGANVSAQAHAAAAESLLFSTRRREAVVAAQKAVRLAPQWWMAHFLYARALAETQHPAESHVQYEEAIRVASLHERNSIIDKLNREGHPIDTVRVNIDANGKITQTRIRS